MKINRDQRRATVAPGRVRYRVLVTTPECVPGSHESRVFQSLLMRLLADDLHLLNCGYAIPERITISHNGTCWQAEAEAEVDEPNSL